MQSLQQMQQQLNDKIQQLGQQMKDGKVRKMVGGHDVSNGSNGTAAGQDS
jgi:hypothetical protein